MYLQEIRAVAGALPGKGAAVKETMCNVNALMIHNGWSGASNVCVACMVVITRAVQCLARVHKCFLHLF